MVALSATSSRPIGAPSAGQGAKGDILSRALAAKPEGTQDRFFAVGNDGGWVMYDLDFNDVKKIFGPAPFTFFPDKQ